MMKNLINKISKKIVFKPRGLFSTINDNSKTTTINTDANNLNNTSNQNAKTEEKTSFGFRTVNQQEKQKLVNEVFSNVASRYDLMNDVMSVGIHRVWKNEFVDEIGVITSRITNVDGKVKEEPTVILDVAGGTGDIAFRIFEKYRQRAKITTQKEIEIRVFDINQEMLDVGKERAKQLGYDQNIEFVHGNAEDLSRFADNSIDLYTIAFGIRNVPNIKQALKEAHRVLRKGGRFMCLEFSKVQNPIFSQIYNIYSFNIIPFMGQVIANDRGSYQYLVESIEKFPNQDLFAQYISEAGFKYVSYKNYTNGIVALHSGFKL